MKRAILALGLWVAPAVSWANPEMSSDFLSMMRWLSQETAQGLAFDAGSTFDDPTELTPFRIHPDLSLGIGVIPLNKGRFPTIETSALAEMNPDAALPNSVTIPNLILHARMGLPDRWGISLRGANMTIPKGFKFSPQTRGDGQSNSVGMAIHKYFLGGNSPLVSVTGSFNYVHGYVNFYSEYTDLEITPGIRVNSKNTGILEWNVGSVGVSALVSQPFGVWTPYAGLGYNRMSGSVRGRLKADFDTPLIINPIGEASDHPEEHQGRVIVGAQLDRAHLSYFLHGEFKATGASVGKTFVLSLGMAVPFRLGPVSGLAKSPAKLKDEMLAYEAHSQPPTSLPKAAQTSIRRSFGTYRTNGLWMFGTSGTPVLRLRETPPPAANDGQEVSEPTLIR